MSARVPASSVIVHGSLIVSQLAMALSVVGLESAGASFPFSLLALLRLMFAVPALFAVSLVFEPGATLPPRDIRCILQMVAMGLCGYTVNALLFLKALSMTSSMNSSALQPAIIVFTGIISVLLGLEPRRGLGALLKLVGLAAAITGAVLMSRVDVFLRTGNVSEATIVVANILFIIQTLAWSIYLTFQRYPLQKFPSPIAFTGWCALIGAVPIFFVALFDIADVRWSEVGWWAWAAVAFAGIVGNGVAFSIISWVIQRASPFLPAVYNCLLPPFTALFRFVLFGGVPTARDVIGTTIIVSGLAIVTYARSVEAASAAAAKAAAAALEAQTGTAGDFEAALCSPGSSDDGPTPISDETPLLMSDETPFLVQDNEVEMAEYRQGSVPQPDAARADEPRAEDV